MLQAKKDHERDLQELKKESEVSRVDAERKSDKLMEELTNVQLNFKLESADLRKELNLTLTAL